MFGRIKSPAATARQVPLESHANIESECAPASIDIDDDGLTLILSNLADNAIKFTTEAGERRLVLILRRTPI